MIVTSLAVVISLYEIVTLQIHHVFQHFHNLRATESLGVRNNWTTVSN